MDDDQRSPKEDRRTKEANAKLQQRVEAGKQQQQQQQQQQQRDVIRTAAVTDNPSSMSPAEEDTSIVPVSNRRSPPPNTHHQQESSQPPRGWAPLDHKEKVPLLSHRPQESSRAQQQQQQQQSQPQRYGGNDRPWQSGNKGTPSTTGPPPPLLGQQPHPPPLLPCPPHPANRRFPLVQSWNDPPHGPPSSDLVVQQALSKAQQREKEEHLRYEEKMGKCLLIIANQNEIVLRS